MAVKILYAEDELFLGKIVKESLESRGYEVIMVGDGNKVLSVFTQQRPQVCVLDIMLPNKDGYTLAQEIRDLDKDIPLIFLTAKTQTDDLVKGFKSGGNDYIRKPFSMEELIVRIENVLERNSAGDNPALFEAVPIGGFIFHGNRQLLVHDGAEKSSPSGNLSC